MMNKLHIHEYNRVYLIVNKHIQTELKDRNNQIFKDYQNGYKVRDLSDKYFLSEKSIQRILYGMK